MPSTRPVLSRVLPGLGPEVRGALFETVLTDELDPDHLVFLIIALAAWWIWRADNGAWDNRGRGG